MDRLTKYGWNPHARTIVVSYRGRRGGGNERGNQVFNRISTTHGHISDYKLDSVVHTSVGVMS